MKITSGSPWTSRLLVLLALVVVAVVVFLITYFVTVSHKLTHLTKSLDISSKLVQSLMTNHHLALHEMFPVAFQKNAYEEDDSDTNTTVAVDLLVIPDGFMMGTATAAYQVEGAWNESGTVCLKSVGESSVTICLHSLLLTT